MCVQSHSHFICSSRPIGRKDTVQWRANQNLQSTELWAQPSRILWKEEMAPHSRSTCVFPWGAAASKSTGLGTPPPPPVPAVQVCLVAQVQYRMNQLQDQATWTPEKTQELCGIV